MSFKLLILLTTVSLCLGEEGKAASGTDYTLSDRLKTKRWIDFHPTRAVSEQDVVFTFTGFWAFRSSPLTVRLGEDSTCAEYQILKNNAYVTQEVVLVERRATLTMPSGNWTGGFCIKVNNRWQQVDNTLNVVTPMSTSEVLMQGYQSCSTFMTYKKRTIPNICGCFFQNKLTNLQELSTRYYPITITETFDNRELAYQTSSLNVVQGCCQHSVPIRETYWLVSGGAETKWGYCADHLST